MTKNQLAERLAKEENLSKAAAADRLDCVVNRILTSLRKGREAKLPGLGTFLPGIQPNFRFDRPMKKPRKRGRG